MNGTDFTMLTIAGFALMLATSPAAAQDAMGSGTALDAGLSAHGGRINLPSAQEDFRARNLLITNNIIGGRGFRGTVGYTAEYDFRDTLGTDDLYAFRRDSAWSDVSYLNYGNTYQRLRFGQSMGLLEYRRDAYGASPQTVDEGIQYRAADLINAQLRLDQVSFSSSTSMASRLAAEPIQIGYTKDEEGVPYLINASSLTGLDVTPLQQEHQLLGLSTYDLARVREDLVAQRDLRQLGAPFTAKYEDLLAADLPSDERITGRVEPGTLENRIDLRSEPEFRQILERIASRYADRQEAEAEETPDLYKDLDADLRRIREYLAGRDGQEETAEERAGFSLPSVETQETQEPRKPQDPLEELEIPDRTAPGLPGTSDFQVTPPPLPAPEGEEEEEEAGPAPLQVPLQVDIEEFGTILRHGERIEALTSRDQNRFNELLTGAEEKLRVGEYFWAERRFNRALRFTPGHPLATAGLAHAQIGAGLYLSASLTLQSLFRYQPEMIDAHYEEGLVPNRVRLLQARDTLRDRLDETRDRVSNGFLLAYIGRLLEDRPIIEQGLAVMEDAEPDNPLLRLLKEVWLAEDDEDAAAEDASETSEDEASEAGGESEADEPEK